jgi:hypothetical protein
MRVCVVAALLITALSAEDNSGRQIIHSTAKTDTLTTNFAMIIPTVTLPPGVEPKEFKSLTDLFQVGEGYFGLEEGSYEICVESFSLDAAPSVTRGGYYPASIGGSRQWAINEVLQSADLSRVSHAAIQELLTGIVSGMNLEDMSPQAQKTAASLMKKEDIGRLRGTTTGKVVQKHVLNWVNKQLSKNAQQAIGDAQNREAQADQKYGISDALKNHMVQPHTQADIPRGTWVLMPEGYYLRYLPEGRDKMRVQLIVPESAIRLAENHVIGFALTEYVAVSGSQRVALTMRVDKP